MEIERLAMPRGLPLAGQTEQAVKADESSSYLVNADEGKIKEVIGNLLNNAIKYTPVGTRIV